MDRSRVLAALRETVEPAAELAVIKGVLHCSGDAFPAYAREGLGPADFSEPGVSALYAYCRGRHERSVPNSLIDVYAAVGRDTRGADRDPTLAPAWFFGRGFAKWLADAFTCEWWPDDGWAVREFADGRADSYEGVLWVATVAARRVRLNACRRRTIVGADELLAAAVSGKAIRLHRPTDQSDDDWVETRGPS